MPKSLKGRTSWLRLQFARAGSIEVQFRSDRDPNWRDWTTLSAETLPNVLTQQHDEIFALPGLPEQTVNDRTVGRKFHWMQVRLTGDVPVKLREMHLDADIDPNPMTLEPTSTSTSSEYHGSI
jgi:hypothetical protein